IIRVFDYGVDEIGPYYTMEFLEGQDMRQASPLPYQQACLYLRDVATSLALLHARRIVHRDVSPGNVRMTSDGHCKLLDFGALSPFGPCNTIVGTPPAIPQEALADAPLDQRADLYSLGALAYWMLTGRHAYPARRLEDLLGAWAKPVPRPSTLVPGLPAELEGLVLSLLSADPLARPETAAEVIARLTVIGELPPEDSSETSRLALSFLSSPRFIGRATELRNVQALIHSALEGRGATVCIEAAAGMGRSRLLEEIAVRAQLAGASVVRVDASMHRNTHGTTRALALRLFDALPDVARAHAGRFRAALTELGQDVTARAGLDSLEVARPSSPGAALARQLEAWFAEVSRAKPLVIEVDNVEYSDDASLGLIAALGGLAATHSMLVVVTERTNREARAPLGLLALRSHSHRILLPPFTGAETLELIRSVVGDAPNVARFSEWLHGRTAGSPLHAIEISRQLLEKQVVRYTGGIWTLPDHKPDAELPAALGDALALRIASLSKAARSLAECLSLHHDQPTLEFCRALSGETDDRAVLVLLDELAQRDVLYVDRDGYGFSSTAIRDALLSGADLMRLEENHRRLGEAFTKLGAERDPLLRLHAGWHLIRGGDELRGAELIASVTYDAVTARTLVANLNRIGHPVEAALKVFGKYRQSVYNRMPLLAVLAQAGYYEDRCWAERYGDEALYALDDLCGLRAARRLRRFFGRFLGLLIGVLFAVIRFQLRPRE
ncbi:MAG TPA: AAA family ATPase, partial [Polyangiaceae bacterium]